MNRLPRIIRMRRRRPCERTGEQRPAERSHPEPSRARASSRRRRRLRPAVAGWRRLCPDALSICSPTRSALRARCRRPPHRYRSPCTPRAAARAGPRGPGPAPRRRRRPAGPRATEVCGTSLCGGVGIAPRRRARPASPSSAGQGASVRATRSAASDDDAALSALAARSSGGAARPAQTCSARRVQRHRLLHWPCGPRSNSPRRSIRRVDPTPGAQQPRQLPSRASGR